MAERRAYEADASQQRADVPVELALSGPLTEQGCVAVATKKHLPHPAFVRPPTQAQIKDHLGKLIARLDAEEAHREPNEVGFAPLKAAPQVTRITVEDVHLGDSIVPVELGADGEDDGAAAGLAENAVAATAVDDDEGFASPRESPDILGDSSEPNGSTTLLSPTAASGLLDELLRPAEMLVTHL